MKLHREFFVVCYIFVLLLNDPGMMRACMLDRGLVYAPANGFERRFLPGFPERSGREPHMNPDSTDIHLYYVLDGGRNSDHNPDFLTGESLPFVPDVPVREGYNFAGLSAGSHRQRGTVRAGAVLYAGADSDHFICGGFRCGRVSDDF